MTKAGRRQILRFYLPTRYREALLNPPLLAVCDFDRYSVKTNFNVTVCEPHEFANYQIYHF